jgi:hypothetical protein
MNDLVIQPGERVLKEERDVIWRKSWLGRVRGRLCFTTQRLIFEAEKAVALTASQALVNELQNRVPVDIPRDRLEAAERGKQGKNEVLVVRTEDEEFKFLLRTPVKEWEATLRQAMHDDKVARDHLLERLKPKENPPPYR